MNYEKLQFNLNAYKETGEILDGAKFLIHQFDLDDDNFAGFGFREELETNSILLTANGELGELQHVMIPRNLFDFDLTLTFTDWTTTFFIIKRKTTGRITSDLRFNSFGH